VRSAPLVNIVNTYAWASFGSWGTPGEQLSYAIDVINNDSGCGSSTFTVSLTAPSGFAVSAPVSVSVGSGADGYAMGTATSPVTAADGNYAISATASRSGSASATGQSLYMVYSSDSTAPAEYWWTPAQGAAVSGRSLSVGFTASDEHRIAQLSVAIDGAAVASTTCSVTYDCQLAYNWSIRRVSGTHTATFTARDAVGNVASTTHTFSVN